MMQGFGQAPALPPDVPGQRPAFGWLRCPRGATKNGLCPAMPIAI